MKWYVGGDRIEEIAGGVVFRVRQYIRVTGVLANEGGAELKASAQAIHPAEEREDEDLEVVWKGAWASYSVGRQ